MTHNPRRPSHVIPSQNFARRPGVHGHARADVQQMTEMQKRHTALNAPGGGSSELLNTYSDNTVLSIYDSRPLNGTDFLKATRMITVLAIDNRSFSVALPVPSGYVAILRTWEVSAIFTATGPTPVVNADGTSNVIARFGFAINGIDIPQYSDNEYNTLAFGVVTGNSFIPVASTDQLTLNVDLSLSPAGIEFLDGQITLYGNLLIATGRDINYEQSTENALPVRITKE